MLLEWKTAHDVFSIRWVSTEKQMFAIFLSLSPRPSASDDKTGLLDGSNGQVKIYKKVMFLPFGLFTQPTRPHFAFFKSLSKARWSDLLALSDVRFKYEAMERRTVIILTRNKKIHSIHSQLKIRFFVK